MILTTDMTVLCSTNQSGMARPKARSRSAFTLVEMLVALSIVLIASGIGLYALFAHRNSSRLLAAEQVMADIIRQAGATAKTSGEPVVVHFAQNVNSSGIVTGTTVSGVSRACIWSQSFDDSTNMGNIALPFSTPSTSTGYPDTDPNTGLTIGRSGFGVWPKILNAGGGDQSSVTNLAMIKKVLQHPLPPQSNLVNSVTRTSSGFYLACSVRPPASYTTAYNPAQPVVIPLIALADGSNDYASNNTTIAYLQLMQAQTPAPAGQPIGVTFWDLVGWVNGESSTVTIDQFGINNTAMIAGDSWVDVGLLYDGNVMQLLINGHIVGPNSFSASVPVSLLAPASESVFIGHYLNTNVSPNIVVTADAQIDDVRLFRLASDRSISFPEIVAETPGELTMTPDGQASMSLDPTMVTDPFTNALPAYRNPIAGTVLVQGVNQQERVSPNAQMLIFTKRTSGQLDPGPTNALVIAVRTSGVVSSSLANMELAINPPGTYYAVYTGSLP